MNAQQAPCASRQALRVGRAPDRIEERPVDERRQQLPRQPERSRAWRARSASSRTGWRGSTAAPFICRSALQRDAPVVPVHERRDRQADGEVHRHDDGDALDRLAGLVHGGVGDRDQVRVADRHRERAVLGEVQVLAGQRRHDQAQRLRQHDVAQRAAARRPSECAASTWPAPPRARPRARSRR